MIHFSSRGGKRRRQRAEHVATIARSQQVFTSSLRMRHQAEYVAISTTDAGNIVARPIRICRIGYFPGRVAVAKNDPIIAFQFIERLVVADVVAFGVGDWQTQYSTSMQLGGKRCV